MPSGQATWKYGEGVPDTPPTVAVLTAQPPEYTAKRARLTDIEKQVHPTGTRAETGQLPGTTWRVALLEMGEGARPAEARAHFLQSADAYTRASAPAEARTQADDITP